MNSLFQLREISGRLVQESKSHRIMSIRNRESHRMMKQPSCRRQECFTENHRGYGGGSNELVPVIECFGSSADRSSEEALKIPGLFAIAVQPVAQIR